MLPNRTNVILVIVAPNSIIGTIFIMNNPESIPDNPTNIYRTKRFIRRIFVFTLLGVLLSTTIITIISAGKPLDNITGGPKYSASALVVIDEATSKFAQRCEMLQPGMCEAVDYLRQIRIDGLENTLKDLLIAKELNYEFSNACHEISHTIGQIAYADEGLSALSRYRGDCGWGVMHGILYQWVASSPSKEVEDSVANVCEAFSQYGEPGISLCLHGVGHALHRSKLDWYSAAKICEDKIQLPSSKICINGAIMDFMDYKMSEMNLLDKTQIVAETNRCLSFKSENRLLCAYSFGGITATAYNFDYSKAQEMCELVSSELRTPCGFGLGRGTLFAYEGDIALPISKCKEVLDLSLRGECMAGAAEVLATNFTDFAIAEKVCASDIESVNARCRLELEDIAGALNNEAAKELGF